eukprot:5401189-Amphidinium_carterae.1
MEFCCSWDCLKRQNGQRVVQRCSARPHEVKAQASMEKGPQPLRGRLRLRIEKVGPDSKKEL